MRKFTVYVASFLFAFTLVLVFAQEMMEAEGAGIQVAEHETLGPYLTDAEGMSLYLFLNDRTGEAAQELPASTCYDQCAENWPPFTTETWPLPEGFIGEGVDASLLNMVEREDDGSLQVIYHDWPLYYFAGDENPGDINGQGRGEVWYLVSPEGEAIGLEEEAAEPAEEEVAEVNEVEVLSVWDGVYTEEQAERGSGVYDPHCASCHGGALGGVDPNPPLADRAFVRYWGGGGRTVHDLFEYTSTNMPLDRPGSLSDQQYIDVIALIFQANGFPAGEEELVPDPEILMQMIIQPEPDPAEGR